MFQSELHKNITTYVKNYIGELQDYIYITLTTAHLMGINESSFKNPVHDNSASWEGGESLLPSVSLYSFSFGGSWEMNPDHVTCRDVEESSWIYLGRSSGCQRMEMCCGLYEFACVVCEIATNRKKRWKGNGNIILGVPYFT